MDEACHNCKYFLFWRKTSQSRSGMCRRYPPTVYHEDNPDCCPVVNDNEWCGEWKPNAATIMERNAAKEEE